MQTDQNGQNRQSKLRRRLFGAAAALVFLWMLLLNVLTPYIADDFTFAYAFDTGLRLHSLPQLIKSLAYHYYEWSGRVVVKFFAQGFTMLPKFVFDLCNAAAYLGLGLVIYRLAAGRRRGRYDVLSFFLIEAALWEVSPAFGQTNLWMRGACNYLWASLGLLAFLLPWRYYLQPPFSARPRMAVGMALAGVLAGWLSENGSAGMLVCLVLCIWWLLAGRPNRRTANDNTSGVIALLEMAAALPPEDRDAVCFVWFDNEELGLFGSSAFAAAHRRVRADTLTLNFDCVGDGDYLQFFPSGVVKKDSETVALLESAFLSEGKKVVEVVRGLGLYPSDQARFRRGVGVAALKKAPLIGYYMDRIHTRRDTVLEEDNVQLLCRGVLRLAGMIREQKKET